MGREVHSQFSPSMGLTLTDLCAILLAVALAWSRQIIYRSLQVRKNPHLLETCYPYLERSYGKRTLVRVANVVRIYLSKITLLPAYDVLGSDIIYLEGPGLSLIVLNSVKSVTDLLDKRSAIYSSRSALFLVFFLERETNNTHRPRATMVNEL